MGADAIDARSAVASVSTAARALITGASRNIGAAISRAFAEAGANLVVNARAAGPLEAFAAALRERLRRRR